MLTSGEAALSARTLKSGSHSEIAKAGRSIHLRAYRRWTHAARPASQNPLISEGEFHRQLDQSWIVYG